VGALIQSLLESSLAGTTIPNRFNASRMSSSIAFSTCTPFATQQDLNLKYSSRSTLGVMAMRLSDIVSFPCCVAGSLLVFIWTVACERKVQSREV
jgi:hypothetical protein